MNFLYKPSTALLLIFIVLFHLPTFAATYYFSTSGSDANSGLSASSPKQSIAAAVELMGNGNTILFKRGDIWYIPQKTMVLDNRSNFTLNSYGSGNRPVIAGMAWLNSAWTYQGDSIWSHPTIYTDALRVFVDNVSRISLDDKADNNPVRADLNAVDEYLYDKTAKKLLIYHTSPTTPPKNVLMIPGWPAPSLVNMVNTTNVTIRNIEFWGGGNLATIRINAPSSNIMIDNCVVARSNLMGIFAINDAQNMNVVENLVIQNCIIDKSWTQPENNLKPTLFLDGDGIAFMHGVKNSMVKNCKIGNWGHDGISVLATEFTTGIYGVKYNKFEGNEIFAGNSAYMHAFGVSGFKDLAMYNIFKRNYCHGFSSGNTVGGNTNFVFSNVIANVEVSPLLQHSQAPHAINLATWTIKDKRGVSGSMECKNNWIVNNTIYNTDTYSFLIDRSNLDGDLTALTDNKIYNNLLHNYGLDTTFTPDAGTTSQPGRIGIRILTNVKAGVTSLKNNNFWAEWDSTASRPVALYQKHFYNAAQLTNCIECGTGMVSDNTQSNPFFGRFYGLTSTSSDFIKNGGFSYAPAMIAAGLPAGELVDYYGKSWPNVGWSVGAIQYIEGNEQVLEGGDTTYYKDADGDTYGDINQDVVASSIPEGYVRNSDDFDDTDADLYPGAVEKCNGKDDNGNGLIDEGATNTYFKDADGDTYGDPANSVTGCSAPEGYVSNHDDFDDTDPTLNPGAAEICNGKDDDGDGQIDEGVQTTFYRDADGDTYGDAASSVMACSAPGGYVANRDDFDDADAARYPGAPEICNGKDDNGDGQIDEGVKTTFYRDADGDTFGDKQNTTAACSAPDGYVTNSNDIDDTDPNIYPNAPERCNGKDDNGNGTIDEGVTTTYYLDNDGDGYGSSVTISACAIPARYVTNNTDCNDNNASVHPGATEVCNGIDDDCDGQIDEGVKTTFYRDADGDTFGDKQKTTIACSAPVGYVTNSNDIDDTDPKIYPGAPERCNGKDDNGNGSIDEGVTTTYYLDNDGDGHGSSVTINACSIPARYVTNNTDCNDNNASVHPGATEICNGIDDDCDGQIDEGVKTTFYFDKDGDGYGDKNVRFEGCAPPAGYVSNSGDCNDNASNINPGSAEICGNAIDENCNGATNEGCVAVTLPTITINSPTVTEGNSGTKNVTFTLTLSKAWSVPVTVKYATANNDATSADYVARSGTATFAANVRTVSLTVGIQGDVNDEVNETFKVVLSQPVNATIAKTTGTCTITDNDSPPVMVISDVMATEISLMAFVKVSLSVVSGRPVSVKFDTRDGSAVAPADYISQLNGTLNFAPGEKEKFIQVVLKKDNVNEATERFNVALKQPSLATISRSLCVVSILNSSTVVAKTAVLEQEPAVDQELSVVATPNPTTNQFIVRITGGQGRLTVRVVDVRGRTIEVRATVPRNVPVTMGAGWTGGAYFVEVFDKKQKVTVKLLKLN